MQRRLLTADDAEQAWTLDHDAFHTDPVSRDGYLRHFEPERLLGVFDGDRLIALAGAYPFGQFFGGRSVPMGGVSSVCVAPDQRGQGHARPLLTELIELMAERGEVIASLYPAATALYRSLGWELAGAHVVRSIDPAALRSLPAASGVRVRPAHDGDFSAMAACYRRLASETNGFVDLSEDQWRARSDPTGRALFVAERDGGEIVGYAIQRQFDGETTHMGGGPFGIRADDVVAIDRDAILALWRMLGSWSSVANQVVYWGASEDPLLLLLPEQHVSVLAEARWMTRLVDAAGAMAARGFAPGIAGEVKLRVRDDIRSANDGTFTLSIADGAGRLEPSQPDLDAIELDIGAFASLYTGWSDTATLSRIGRLSGGSAEARRQLDGFFAGPAPWMPTEF